jgi:hypothetical protein
VYYIKQPAKVRYIDPLCNGARMSTSCQLAKKMISKNLSYDMGSYVYLPDVSLWYNTNYEQTAKYSNLLRYLQ